MEIVAIGGAIALAGAISGWIAAFMVQRQKGKEEIRAVLAETQRDGLDKSFTAYKKRAEAKAKAQSNAIKTLETVAVNSGGDARVALSILAEQLLANEDSDEGGEDSEVRPGTQIPGLPDGTGDVAVRPWRGMLGRLLGGTSLEVRVPRVGVDDGS